MLALLIAAQLAAQPAPGCRASPPPLAAELAGWAASGDRLESRRSVLLRAGEGADLAARLPASSRPGGAAAAPFTVPAAGTYGIALDQRAWIDIYPDGEANRTAIASTAHGHGPACSGIAKIVRFRLNPGGYILHLSGITGQAAKVLLIAADRPAPNR